MSTFIKKYLTISVLRLAIKAGEVLPLPAATAGVLCHPISSRNPPALVIETPSLS